MKRPKKRVYRRDGVLDPDLCQSLFRADNADGIRHIVRKTGMSQSHIWRVLAGERVPSVIAFRKMSDAFGLDMEEFYELLYSRDIKKITNGLKLIK